LGLNWDSFKWRNYDYAIGRFMSIDPLTEEYNTWSPYVFSGNRVIDARELEGLEPELLKDLWNSAKNLVKSTEVKSVSLGIGGGFKIYNTGINVSVSNFEYNIKDNTFSFDAIKGFIGSGYSDNAVTAEANVAYSSKNFDNEKSEGGFIRVKGTLIKEGEKKEGSVAVFAKNKENEKGAVLIETSTEKKDDKTSNYATPETDTSYKLKLGFGIELSVDWDKCSKLQNEIQN